MKKSNNSSDSNPDRPEEERKKVLDSLEVGKKYLTRGGWEAIVIWEVSKPDNIRGGWGPAYWVVHKPGTKHESEPALHCEGKAIQQHDYVGRRINFEVGSPPSYGQHPADLVAPIKEEARGEKNDKRAREKDKEPRR